MHVFSLFFSIFHSNNTGDKHTVINTHVHEQHNHLIQLPRLAIEEEKYPPLQPSFNSAFYELSNS